MDADYTLQYEEFEQKHWWFVVRRRIIQDAIRRYVRRPGRTRWLDVGCGTGVLLDDSGFMPDKVGLELEAGCVGRARSRGLDVRRTEADWDLTPVGRCGLVTLCDVLEHLPDEHKALDAVEQVLRPRGLLLVTVPAMPSLWSRHDEINHHFRRYRRRQLLGLFDPARWQVLRCTYFSSMLLPAIWGVRQAKRLTGRGGDHDFRFASRPVDAGLRAAFAVERPLLGFADLPLGSSLLLVARRRAPAAACGRPADARADSADARPRTSAMSPPTDLPTPILITGSRGMLAHALKRSLRRRGFDAVGVDRADADLTDPAAVDAVFDRLRPRLVLNAAAYTAVDKAEQEPELAHKVNADAVALLARACSRHDATLVHVSTDFVFDGRGDRPYREDDKPNPVSAYGRSKLAGEAALEASGHVNWLVLRTAWLYGPGETARPFPKIILDAARAGKPLRVVGDQRGCPTFTFDLADAALDLVKAGARGTFHVVNAGETTWHAFARETLRVFGVEAPVEAITAADWQQMRPDSAPRPAYSVLDTSRTAAAVGRPMRPWQAALREYREIVGG